MQWSGSRRTSGLTVLPFAPSKSLLVLTSAHISPAGPLEYGNNSGILIVLACAGIGHFVADMRR